MRGPATYTSLDDTLQIVESKMRVVPSAELVDVRNAFRRILADDVVAKVDIPPRPVSHMDGYALRARDVAGSPGKRLKVRGEVKLGETPRVVLGRDEAVAVATGSYLPDGSDSVIPVEEVGKEDGAIVTMRVPDPREHVYAAGADVKRGTTVLSRGKALRAQDIGMLMILGSRKVKVFRKVRVALLATGSELTDSPMPKKGKVWNSHGVVFAHLLSEIGCEAVQLGVVRDDAAAVAARLREALRKSDLVLLMGGTSVGRHDLVEEVVSTLRPDALVHGVKMDRGRVTGCAVVRGRPVLMLPGPIQGGMNAFFLIGLPLIRKLAGATEATTKVTARIRNGWEARRRYQGFAKVVYLRLAREGGVLYAEPLAGETESISLLAASDAFTVVPEDAVSLGPGQDVDAYLVPGFSWVS